MRNKSKCGFGATVLLFAFATATFAAEEPPVGIDAYNECLLEKLRTATDETPVSEIRRTCLLASQDSTTDQRDSANTTAGEQDASTALAARMEETRATEEMRFVISPFKPNYFIFAYNDNGNTAPFEEAFPAEDIEFRETEVKFQISIMFPLVQNVFGNNGDLYFAFTNRSFWQVFNDSLSAPFRETNYEPEFWFQFDNDGKILGLTSKLITFGYNHQSNGRNTPISRSWNRIFASFLFERGNLALAFKPWIVFGDIDDNADIEDYMGNSEILAAYKWKRHTFSLLSRNQLQSGFSRGAFQLDWSMPLYHRLRFYAQYFNGYGESLIDYNYFNNTLGVGVSLTDYF